MRKLMLTASAVGMGLLATAAVMGADKRSASRGFELQQLPGAYQWVERAGLSTEQAAALDKVLADWSARQADALKEVPKRMPMLSLENQRDPAKMKEWYAKRTALLAELKAGPPIDEINALLTAEQRAKVDGVNAACKEWRAGAREEMEKARKELERVLGPEPAKKAAGGALSVWGAGLSLREGPLIERLGLTAEQVTKLEELARTGGWTWDERAQALRAPTSELTAGLGYVHPVWAVAREVMREETRKLLRERVAEVLTPQQRAKFEKAAPIAEERDRAVWEKFRELETKVDGLLPRKEEKFEFPAVIVHPPGEGP